MGCPFSVVHGDRRTSFSCVVEVEVLLVASRTGLVVDFAFNFITLLPRLTLCPSILRIVLAKYDNGELSDQVAEFVFGKECPTQ
jgi:hypothetical protein